MCPTTANGRRTNSTNAINAAIRVQEKILVNENDTDCRFSIGISTGEFRRISIDNKTFDYLGSVVDKAFRLCSKASPRAIFADDYTVNAANRQKIVSAKGSVDKFDSENYTGQRKDIELKGFADLVSYYEINWGGVDFDIKNNSNENKDTQLTSGFTEVEAFQKIINEEISKFEAQPPIKTNGDTKKGVFKDWTNTEYGFLTGDDGEEYFVHKSDIINGHQIDPNTDVFFIVETTNKKKDKAVGVIPTGISIDGRIVKCVKEKDFAYIKNEEVSKLHRKDIFLSLIDYDSNLEVGDPVKFTLCVHYNAKEKKNIMAAKIDPKPSFFSRIWQNS